MTPNLKVVLALAGCLAAGPALAADPFFPSFGNKGYDVLNYDLDLDVAPAANNLDGRAELTIRAHQRLGSFRLDLAGLKVSAVSVDGKRAGFSQKGEKLTIVPPKPIAKDAKFTVLIVYAGKPTPIQDPTAPDDPSLTLGWFHYKRGTYVVSEPVGALTFFPANDELTDKATYTFTVTVPKGYAGVANGLLTKTETVGNKLRFTWQMREPMTTWLATVHVNKFKVSTARTASGTPLRVYTTDKTPKADIAGYLDAKKMLTYFEGLVGKYPFESYGSVVVDDPILYYALETQTMSTFPLGAADAAVVAHELAHQWFGNSVSVSRWKDLWLAEGFATYFEVLWPNRHDPAGFDADMTEIYDYVVQEKIGPAVVETPEQLFSDRTYLRGGSALYALQLKVGEKTFMKIMRTWATKFRYHKVSSTDFVDTAVEVSGDKSVRKLLNAWLYEAAVPDLPGREKSARKTQVARPDLVGLRCGHGAHRGGPRTCAEPAAR